MAFFNVALDIPENILTWLPPRIVGNQTTTIQIQNPEQVLRLAIHRGDEDFPPEPTQQGPSPQNGRGTYPKPC
jgi:hypothetical protein